MQEVHSGCLVESCAATHEQARRQEELLLQQLGEAELQLLLWVLLIRLCRCHSSQL